MRTEHGNGPQVRRRLVWFAGTRRNARTTAPARLPTSPSWETVQALAPLLRAYLLSQGVPPTAHYEIPGIPTQGESSLWRYRPMMAAQFSKFTRRSQVKSCAEIGPAERIGGALCQEAVWPILPSAPLRSCVDRPESIDHMPAVFVWFPLDMNFCSIQYPGTSGAFPIRRTSVESRPEHVAAGTACSLSP
jgi:hypothetical protein